jgi:signal transduction histidine kinase
MRHSPAHRGLTMRNRFHKPESRLIIRFGLVALLPVIGLGVALGFEVNAEIHQHDVVAAANSADLMTRVGVQPLLSRADMAGGLSPDRITEVDQSLAREEIGKSATRIKVWNVHGMVIYSDNASLIGKSFPIDADLASALAGTTNSGITSGHESENAGDELPGPLIQVYVPLIFAGDSRPSGAFEVYVPYVPVQASIDRESNQLYWMLGIGLGIFYALMLPIFIFAERWRRHSVAVSASELGERLRGDEAERLSEVKSQFLATTSHELRTPLNSVLGFAQLLKLHVHGTLSERQEQYVDNIETSGRHLLAILNDVLDLAKIEAGKLELDVEPIRVDRLVIEATDAVEPLAATKRIPIKVTGGAGLRAAADERRLTQVLINVLSNSIKFTPVEGRIRVEIGIDAKDQVQVDVVDTGSGIAPGEQDGIFEEFNQAEAGRRPSVEGTGLGLPISRRLMRLMNGNLTLVESTPEGSRFRLSLPAAAAPAATAAKAS